VHEINFVKQSYIPSLVDKPKAGITLEIVKS